MLNCVLRYIEAGYEYVADQRQSEKVLDSLSPGAGCNTTATSGLKPLLEALLKDVPVPVGGQTEFRGQAARANYLSADRVDQRLVYTYPWQQASGIDVCSDTGSSGCLTTRRSTS